MSIDAKALLRIVAERESQDEKWGQQNHPDVSGGLQHRRAWLQGWDEELAEARSLEAAMRKQGTLGWDLILREEVYEALAARTDRERLEELVQVAAVALAWIEAIERRSRRQSAAWEMVTTEDGKYAPVAIED